ncbi:LacI family transcriptional regulator [Ruminococcus sp. YE71]|uniref:LacI family DNA-binding transcriptional regulator n=1 Tax=unclassified Ruminococcus TaxID=2608920 RepID=UPI000885492E|nr:MULTISPECIES: LacI family DNA-binding transcriptional regulator [unclassified Ruminococcus]SDA13430.1 LacI family transcriptional regulator [Ruminococcus sp. YE78]SFW19028.1 LacI family transcriptional regulator [Ruminococcus sp. YE71]
MSKQVTLNDIAKACGTSTVTVSKALADKKGMSDELRRRIKETAQQMGYVPVRSETADKNNRMVGVIIPEKFMQPNGSFYWALYNDLVGKLGEQNYFCLIEMLPQKNEDELVMPQLITEAKVSALISLGQLNAEYVAELKKRISPLLLLDYYLADSGLDSVITNGYGGGYELASYLIRMGHKDIGFIGTVKATSSIFDRYMGYMKAMLENGLTVRPEWTLDDRCDRDFIEIAFPEKLPTAFVCNCDEAAYHAIRQLEAKGLSVPDDVSVVGYDNYLISEVCRPAITTINVDSKQMAASAVKLITDRFETPDTKPVTLTISGELIEKESAKKLGQ